MITAAWIWTTQKEAIKEGQSVKGVSPEVAQSALRLNYKLGEAREVIRRVVIGKPEDSDDPENVEGAAKVVKAFAVAKDRRVLNQLSWVPKEKLKAVGLQTLEAYGSVFSEADDMEDWEFQFLLPDSSSSSPGRKN